MLSIVFFAEDIKLIPAFFASFASCFNFEIGFKNDSNLDISINLNNLSATVFGSSDKNSSSSFATFSLDFIFNVGTTPVIFIVLNTGAAPNTCLRYSKSDLNCGLIESANGPRPDKNAELIPTSCLAVSFCA